MLEDAVLFKDGEGAAREADFLIHAVLFNMDDREAAFARDTRNGEEDAARILLIISVPGCAGSFVLADVDGNVRRLNGKYRVLVQDACAHVGQLAQLAKGHYVDGKRVIDDTGIRDKESRHIRPVLIDVGAHAARDNGTRYIGAAA